MGLIGFVLWMVIRAPRFLEFSLLNFIPLMKFAPEILYSLKENGFSHCMYLMIIESAELPDYWVVIVTLDAVGFYELGIKKDRYP